MLAGENVTHVVCPIIVCDKLKLGCWSSFVDAMLLTLLATYCHFLLSPSTWIAEVQWVTFLSSPCVLAWA